ncbi:bacteriohemerythrin [Telmatospirillum sp. J64-1]|uniref:bacteriohemerythrin n=1 Tax=Telmatospirillum sp. J64-1 TaxID=2502183 RepID=UPI00115E8CA4|nr:bacteriohemerythrin [Telmatospirillum sp. J64-1]
MVYLGGSAKFIEWRPEYSVGNMVLDFDHQTLINIINHLQSTVDQKAGPDEIGRVIDNMVNYIETHFAREEEIMKAADFPDFVEHVAKHREIEKTARDIATLYKKDPSTINVDEVMEFLRNWLTQHILRSDKQYMPYINK